jgi:hypothetical protein
MVRSLVVLALALAGPASAMAQDNPDRRVVRVDVRPAEVHVAVGERVAIEIVALDSDGNVVSDAFIQAFSTSAEASFDLGTYEVEGVVPGTTTVVGRIRRPVPEGPGFENLYGEATVYVSPRPVERVEITRSRTPYFAATRSRVAAVAYSVAGPREDVPIEWWSSDSSVVAVGPDGSVRAYRPGRATLTAAAQGVETSKEVEVLENPVHRIAVDPATARGRVGDVIRLDAVAFDQDGAVVGGAEIEWSWRPTGQQGSSTAWLEAEDDRTAAFVPYAPGPYRLTASIGGTWADVEVAVTPRGNRRSVDLVGHGVVPGGHSTSDFWVFEGKDGRDYAYTGTYSSNLMYAWDVTDPAVPTITDSVSFDGRRVNDVKINADASLAVVTSENAANRRNGITILDLTDPAHPRRGVHFTEQMTGGVHNTWIEGNLVYAIHYGTHDVKIVDISDPESPRLVGEWGLPVEGRYLHDVTILDGLAYLSYWDNGVVILDVGNGVKGGTPTNPVLVSQYQYRYQLGTEWYGNTHHAIRYGDYVFVGDEIFGCSECINGPRGYVHVVDVTDIEHPREVATYRVPEAGVHNMWAEDDLLYIGYYQAGLRVLDISGELRGDLYRQQREVGWYMTQDGQGAVPNATDTWGAQPFKGKIFASDPNSGLWILELEPPSEVVP